MPTYIRQPGTLLQQANRLLGRPPPSFIWSRSTINHIKVGVSRSTSFQYASGKLSHFGQLSKATHQQASLGMQSHGNSIHWDVTENMNIQIVLGHNRRVGVSLSQFDLSIFSPFMAPPNQPGCNGFRTATITGTMVPKKCCTGAGQPNAYRTCAHIQIKVLMQTQCFTQAHYRYLCTWRAWPPSC